MCLPPFGLQTHKTENLPFLNTLILLTSGFSVTLAHHAVMTNSFYKARAGLILTVFLGSLFTELQFDEYLEARFSIFDGIYGSLFFTITDFMDFMLF